jgi:DNA topoisomerase I
MPPSAKSSASVSSASTAAKKVVVVESPAKANTINKYLGSNYTVLASYGHIRDLPPKDGSVDPNNQFRMLWQLDGKAKGIVADIKKRLKGADTLILATDPDREGEAISWHIHEVLKEENALPKGIHVERVVFNEITKKAILAAMDTPRQVDKPLVDAYLARRALDYLVGFTLSPVLWRKLPGSKSAGRVQSVSLRLICERELEIEAFTAQEYWSLTAQVEAAEAGKPLRQFPASLAQWSGKKIDRLTIANEAQAKAAEADIQKGVPYKVAHVEKKTVARHPYPPFITSTLQQDASRKLGFAVTRTMQTAQKLYEGISVGGETVGLITYMRTDGVNLSLDAVSDMRAFIGTRFGDKYLPKSPRMYKSKSKNAQEAHEAIRPTDIRRTPDQVRPYLNEDQARLYELIWKRTVACQMESAQLEQVGVDIAAASGKVVLRSTGSVVVFDGFLSVYQEALDEDKPAVGADGEETASNRQLPALVVGQPVTLLSVSPEQHFTKPPPRYTEASLVKKMEELGIGRPSTYASIIRVLQDRNYVRLESRRFVPEDRGRLVTTFLTHFFKQYVEYDFTAHLEERLDDISADKVSYLNVLTNFWQPFLEAITATKDLTITEVLNRLEDDLGDYFFPIDPDDPAHDPRVCKVCKTGRLGLKLGRFGAFIGCANYPTCKYTKQLDHNDSDGDNSEAMAVFAEGPKVLGNDPATGKEITLHKGPYGYYVQLGDAEEVPPTGRAKKPKIVKPKRSSLPTESKPADMTLEGAIGLLSLPRSLGNHPTEGEPIAAGLGRFGPYVVMGGTFVSLKPVDDVLTITLERAVEVIEASGKKAIHLGEHKKKPVYVKKGRFGFYVAHGKTMANVPKKLDPAALTLEEAVALLEAAPAKTASKPATRRTAAPKRKTASKK